MFDTEPTLYDIYAIGWRISCGKQAGTITGNGTGINPYLLTVDLSRGLAEQVPKCGVQVNLFPIYYVKSIMGVGFSGIFLASLE